MIGRQCDVCKIQIESDSGIAVEGDFSVGRPAFNEKVNGRFHLDICAPCIIARIFKESDQPEQVIKL